MMLSKSLRGAWLPLSFPLLLAACGEPASTPTESLQAVLDDTAIEHALKHADPKYVCPMHSQIVRDEPGSCPICGMDLVAKQIDGGAGDGHPEVTVSAAVQQSLGVRTAPVERRTLWRFIQTVGSIQFDETLVAHIHPRAEGWMEKLAVRSVGEQVTQGQTLGELYAPEILSAQVDFLIALKQGGDKRGVKARKARNLLRLLDVPEQVISDIQRSGDTRNTVPIVAPISGVVTTMAARDGMFINPGTRVYSIADLSRVWVQVNVFEHQIAWLALGQSAEMRVPAFPGRKWEGKVDYIYPELEAKTRTLRVRLVFDNPEGLLKPNMFADVDIFAGPRSAVLSVPEAAVIITGEREAIVKALPEGRFKPTDVVTGLHQGGWVEIIGGVDEGDQVVVSGQFLIDSESSLQASFNRIGGE